MAGLREGVARRSKVASGMLLSSCTMVDMMMVRFVRPRPMVLVGLSVSMGPKGKITSPRLGPKSFWRSLAVRSGLNLVKSTLRLSKGSTSVTFLPATVAGAFFMEGSLLSPWFTRKDARLSGGGPDMSVCRSCTRAMRPSRPPPRSHDLKQGEGGSPQRAHGNDNHRRRLPRHEQDEADQRHGKVLRPLDCTGPDGRIERRAQQPHDGGIDSL